MNGRGPGVSFAVCCYNSASRLPRTLKHLAEQHVPPGTEWEVIIINNGSTDRTAEVARERWPADAPAPLRVVDEPRPGQAHARLRAFEEAQFDIVSFIDDDNWVASDWLEKVFAIMKAHPTVAALGGLNQPASDAPLPWWFEMQQHSYAVGPQSSVVGDVTDVKPRLCGAGLSIRKSAFQDLCAKGFRFILPGRERESLTASEDYELCYALVLAGWRLWYEPALRMQHYLPAHRLQWSYLRRLSRSTSRSGVLLDPYLFAIGKRDERVVHPLLRCWISKVIVSTVRLFGRLLLLPFNWPREGNQNLLMIECLIGRIGGLLSWRPRYVKHIETIREALWRKTKHEEFDLAEPDTVAR